MRTGYIRSHAGPEVVTVGELPDPGPGPCEVRVAVPTAAVNHFDLTRESPAAGWASGLTSLSPSGLSLRLK